MTLFGYLSENYYYLRFIRNHPKRLFSASETSGWFKKPEDSEETGERGQ